MKNTSHKNSRRWLVPEVVQTSAMDCGPAALKCLCEGFGIHVSYGRLREACQTDVDGTSIDTLEEVANQLGLVAEQIMLPVDHLLLSEAQALPAIVVTRLPDGNTHFVVIWRNHKRLLQIMDPAGGRRWPSAQNFLNEVYSHTLSVPAGDWRVWAGSEEFVNPLRQRLLALKLTTAHVAQLLEHALTDASWRALATLDAATRLLNSLVQSRALAAGEETAQVLQRFYGKALREPAQALQIIPNIYWCVRAASEEDAETLLLRGAVLVRVKQTRSAVGAPADADQPAKQPLSKELVAALEEKPLRPARELLNLLLQEGWRTPAILLAALLVTALGFALEALVFRSLMEVWQMLALPGQRLGAMLMLIVFALALVVIQLPIITNFYRLGRRLEMRLRTAFLEKIPKLGDRYFQSRPISDMVQRSHLVHQLRQFPDFAGHFFRAVVELLLTATGIILIDPASAPLALAATACAIAIPLAFMPALQERDLRVRTHSGALSRFYLDALLGLIPIRNHGAERAIRNEHEGLLSEWARANLGMQRTLVLIKASQSVLGFAFAAAILLGYLGRTAETSWALLLAYWALSLPVFADTFSQMLQYYPSYRNIILRLLEPLRAPEEALVTDAPARHVSSSKGKTVGAAVRLEQVSVRVAGHTILHELNFGLQPGEHVAIVGPSGAGKSSLAGILLGWYRAAAGEIFVDEAKLDGAKLEQLRQEIAWVDPAVQLWNRSLFDNLRYGNQTQQASPLGAVLEQAELLGVLQKLPEGLQTPLGEGGGLVSGGEGQRVRLGRAMLRPNARLVILDEPFRGLAREQRRNMLSRARQLWQHATLLCITHDVGETLGFDRVLVIENGRIVDDGIPAELARREDSRYHALLQAETAVRETLWSDDRWRKIWVGMK